MTKVTGIRQGVLHPSESKIKNTGKIRTIKLPVVNNVNDR